MSLMTPPPQRLNKKFKLIIFKFTGSQNIIKVKNQDKTFIYLQSLNAYNQTSKPKHEKIEKNYYEKS